MLGEGNGKRPDVLGAKRRGGGGGGPFFRNERKKALMTNRRAYDNHFCRNCGSKVLRGIGQKGKSEGEGVEKAEDLEKKDGLKGALGLGG